MLEPFVTIEAHRALVSGTSHEPPPLGASGCVVEVGGSLAGGDLVRHGVSTIGCQTTHHLGQKQPACASREEAIG